MLSAHGWLSLTVLSLVRWVPWKKAGNGDCGTILPVTERGERERERDAKRRKRKGGQIADDFTYPRPRLGARTVLPKTKETKNEKHSAALYFKRTPHSSSSSSSSSELSIEWRGSLAALASCFRWVAIHHYLSRVACCTTLLAFSLHVPAPIIKFQFQNLRSLGPWLP